MATSKTLTPTNVTIQIPAMTDAPDQSVNSNCIDKLGDAVNTLNSQMTKILANGAVDNGTVTHDFSALSARRIALVVCTNALFIVTKWSSNITANPAYRDTGITYSIDGNVLTITGAATGGYSVMAL